MRILQINATYGIGSTGRIVADLNKLILAKGYDSFVAVAKSNKTEACYLIGNTFDHKAHAALCRIGGKQAYFSKTATRRLIQYIDNIEPDIIHLHNLHNNYIHLNMLLEYIAIKNIPLVITLHDCWFFTGKCFHYTERECNKWEIGCGQCPKKKMDTPALLYDSTSSIFEDRVKYFSKIKKLYVVGVSQWIANEARRSLLKSADISFCYNGIDTQVFKPSESIIREKNGIKKSDFVIMCMWNKWSISRNHIEREAILGLVDEETKVVILGCPENKKSKGVYYCSTVCNPKEMAEWYSMADVFVNLTWEDSLPFVNIESLGCGTPVITHKTSGATETINDSTGLLVEPGNAKQLVSAINYIRRRGKMAFSDKCTKRANEIFNINDVYEHYFHVYEGIINEKEKCADTCCN